MVPPFWQIVAIDEYIRQVSDLTLGVQDNIQKKWVEVAQHEDPRAVGNTADCGAMDTTFIIVIFPGIPYEFMYEIDKPNRILRLINCRRLSFLDYGQPDIL